MANVSFKNRIALYFSISTAFLVFLVFLVLFLIVKSAVYKDLDNDLDKEVRDLFTEITVNDTGFTIEDEEWEEKEHITLDINPIFIQFTNNNGKPFERSPNLKGATLAFKPVTGANTTYYNGQLDSVAVRQEQIAVKYNGHIVGYMLVATPMEDASRILESLWRTMAIAYPIILLLLYFIARLMAGRSIRPVIDITATADKITKRNLSSRIALPQNRDELYTLSQTINALLDRIENAVLREKQFTSDASHELRTPLAVIKGTLEVLVRKPRSREEYEEKITYCVNEVNRINNVVDQLLLLARFESQKQVIKAEPVNINSLLLDALARHSRSISDKKLAAKTLLEDEFYTNSDEYMLSTIIDNLIGNAVKYCNEGSKVIVSAMQEGESVKVTIQDSGMGIAKEDLERVFNPFYRAKSDSVANIKGSGIGLSIVKRLCDLLGAKITIESTEGIGTTVTLTI